MKCRSLCLVVTLSLESYVASLLFNILRLNFFVCRCLELKGDQKDIILKGASNGYTVIGFY